MLWRLGVVVGCSCLLPVAECEHMEGPNLGLGILSTA